jgi:hypothetical protein
MNIDEIVKELTQLAEFCENRGYEGAWTACAEAIRTIKQLKSRAEKAEARAEAAIKDLRFDSHCTQCKNHRSEGGDCCGVGVCMEKGIRVKWEWRGVQEEK